LHDWEQYLLVDVKDGLNAPAKAGSFYQLMEIKSHFHRALFLAVPESRCFLIDAGHTGRTFPIKGYPHLSRLISARSVIDGIQPPGLTLEALKQHLPLPID